MTWILGSEAVAEVVATVGLDAVLDELIAALGDVFDSHDPGTADDLRPIRLPLHQTRAGAHRVDAGDGPGEARVDQDGRLPPVQSGPTGYSEHPRLDRAPRHRQRRPAGVVRCDAPHRTPYRCRVGARLGHPRHPDGVDPRGDRLRRAGGHPGSRHQSRAADRAGRRVRRQPRRRQARWRRGCRSPTTSTSRSSMPAVSLGWSESPTSCARRRPWASATRLSCPT